MLRPRQLRSGTLPSRLAAAAALGLVPFAFAEDPAARDATERDEQRFQSMRDFHEGRLLTDGDDDDAGFSFEDAVVDMETGRVHYYAIRGEDGFHAVDSNMLVRDGDDMRTRMNPSVLKTWRAFDYRWPQVVVGDDGAIHPASRYLPASALVGRTVEDCFARELGAVEDILIDHDNRAEAYVVLRWFPQNENDRRWTRDRIWADDASDDGRWYDGVAHSDGPVPARAERPRPIGDARRLGGSDDLTRDTDRSDLASDPVRYAIPVTAIRSHASAPVLILRSPVEVDDAQGHPRPWPTLFRSPASRFVDEHRIQVGAEDEGRLRDNGRSDG